MQQKGGREQVAWQIWDRCISEILADFWAVAKVGVAATTGLMAVVSLPRAFVFRINLNDPHPFPWIRAKLSCALGRALHPHPQWDRPEALWESLYPIAGLDEERTRLIGILEQTLPSFVALILNHRPRALRASSLGEALSVAERQPDRLAALHEEWKRAPRAMQTVPPTLAFAVIGQAATIDIETDPPAPVVVREGALVKLEAILKVKPEPPHPQAGAKAVMCGPDLRRLNLDIKFDTENVGRLVPDPADRAKARWDTTNVRPGVYTLKARLVDRSGTVIADDTGRPLRASEDATVQNRPLAHQDTIPVSLRRTAVLPTEDQALWVAIRNRTRAIL